MIKTLSFRFLLHRAVNSNHGLIVRGLVWGLNVEKIVINTGNDPVLQLKILDNQRSGGLTHAAATIRDPLIGAFHWKLSVVRNRHGTFAQIGGIDLNPNRLDGPEHKLGGRKYHDVHCRIQGPAVIDIVDAFRLRWNAEVGPEPIIESITPTIGTAPARSPTKMVQIARTSPKDLYPWAPDGDRTIWATLRQAIRRAKKYIYIEDQYVVAAMLRDELLAALGHVPRRGGKSFLRYPCLKNFFHNCVITNDLKVAKA